MDYWKVHLSEARVRGKNQGGRKGEEQVQYDASTKGMDFVLRSRGMMLERLCVTLYLGRVYCRGVGIYLSSYPLLVFYLSKSKKLTPGDF